MPNSKISSAPKIKLDARKFLGNINKKSFAGQISLVEHKLGRLAKEIGTELRLVSHFGSQIYFEDVGANEYYQADLSKAKGKGGRAFSIENVTQIVIEDNDKGKVFDTACLNLVESLETALDDGDMSKPNSIFEKIVKGHCTPKVVSESGIVNTWDGGRHKINIKSNVVSEDVYPEVVKALTEAVKSSEVVIAEGKITIGEEKIELPISETTRRLAIARNMKAVAENAHDSVNFNRLMKTAAGHISNNSNREVIGLFKTFLTEEQEFTLLNKQDTLTLVENSLYSQGIFNYHVVRNTAIMMWETNCQLNKKDIVEQWAKAASTSGNKQLCENVDILKESLNKAPSAFSESFDTFLCKIFNEDSSSRQVKAKAYLNMLKMLNNVVTGSDADVAVKGSVDDLVMRLESDMNNVDDATLFEVEDLLATVSADLIHDTSTLSDFDTIPEPMAADQFGTEDDIGDFEGDMGDDAGGAGGMGGMGGDIGGGFDAEADASIEDAELADGDEEEEVEDEELQLADVMRDAKPVNEMVADDIKIVLEAVKKMKPEVVKVDGEFRKMLKKGLTESQTTFIKNVMSHSKGVDQELFEGMTSAFYDLVIAEDKDETAQDTYAFESNEEIEVNDEYSGIQEDEGKKKKGLKGGKAEAGLEGAEEDGLEATQLEETKGKKKKGFKGGKKEAGLEGADEDGLEATQLEAKLNEADGSEDNKGGDKDGDYDDNDEDDDKVEEAKSIAIVADDEALMDIISKVLDDEAAPEMPLDLDGEEGDMITGDEDILGDEGMIDGDEEGAIDGDVIDGDEDIIDGEADDEVNDNDYSDDENVIADEEGDDEGESDEGEEESWNEDAVKEDNDITEPTKTDYDSEKAADENGDGDKVNPKPTFSEKDYDGSKGAKTGKQKPGSGHPSA